MAIATSIRIPLADTGQPTSPAALPHASIVWSLDGRRRLTPAPVVSVSTTGAREHLLLRLRSGRQMVATSEQQFLCFDGWRGLHGLAAGDRIATPRRTREPLAVGLGWTDHRLGLLAHLIGDGCVLRKQPVHYTSQDEANLTFVEQAAMEFGISPRRVPQGNWAHVYLPNPQASARGRRNPLHVWFAELGIENLRSGEKRIPDSLFQANDAELAVFLRHLWATDGRVAEPSSMSSGVPSLSYSSSSRALADGVALLLSRFGITSRITSVRKGEYRPDNKVVIQSGSSMRTFCEKVGVHGARGLRAERLLREIEGRKSNTNVDTLPHEVWDLVKVERYRAGLTERQFQAAIGVSYNGSALYKHSPSRERLARCAVALSSDVLQLTATDDVFWDQLVSVDTAEVQPGYEVCVKGDGGFIASGILTRSA